MWAQCLRTRLGADCNSRIDLRWNLRYWQLCVWFAQNEAEDAPQIPARV
jgi:hypothetical protein